MKRVPTADLRDRRREEGVLMKAGMFTGQRFRGMVALGEAEKP